MMIWIRKAALAALVTAAVATAPPAGGQLHEDRMDPVELGIQDLDSLTVPPAPYVGNGACAECHAEAYRTWLGTKHSRTFVWLGSGTARGIARKAGIKAPSPRHSGFCLGCHATAADVAAEWRGSGFRMGEGVACEKCHGPGGEHVRAMRAGGSEDPPLQMPTQDFCLGCHHKKASHTAVPTNGAFVFETYWKRIAHPGKDKR